MRKDYVTTVEIRIRVFQGFQLRQKTQTFLCASKNERKRMKRALYISTFREQLH